MAPDRTRIEVLYFESCPGWQEAVERIRAVLVEAGLRDRMSIHLVAVETEADAHRLRFLGSPSVRVDGHDIERRSHRSESYALQCRLYEEGGRLHAVPPVALIRAALGLSPCGGPAATRTDDTRGSRCP